MMKRIAIAALFALAWAGAAFAQSSPGLVNGQVPTAAQWNSYFSAKQDYLGFPCGITSCTMPGPVVLSGAPVPLSVSAGKFTITTDSNGTITRARDQLLVDDGSLFPGGPAGTLLPNIRAGTAINAAGGGYINVPGASSFYVLSSASNAAIAGQTTTSLQTNPLAQSAIGVIGMCLSNNVSIALPCWGKYGEARRESALGSAYGDETDIGNTQDVVPLESYRGSTPGLTIGFHGNSGGSTDAAIFNPASAAYDVEATGAPFDRGFVFRANSVFDQGGGNFQAMNYPSGYRSSWFRNNSGRDQLQAYITATNTTLGTVVGHDVLALDFSGGGNGAVDLYAENLVLRSASTGNASIQIGKDATGDRQSAVVLVSRASSSFDAALIRSPGVNGKLLLTQLGTGSTDFASPGGYTFSIGAGVLAGTLDASGNWSLGPNAPQAPGINTPLLDINRNSANTATASVANENMLRLINANGVDTTLEMDAFGAANGATVRGVIAGGTLASPTATAINKTPLSLIGHTYDGTGYRAVSVILTRATEAQTGSAHGSNIQFFSVPNGSTTLTQSMVLQGSVVTAPGTVNSVAGFLSNGVAGIDCTGVTAGTVVVNKGLVTHC